MMPRPTIFLVDDDPDFLDMEKRILEAGGYGVSCFAEPRGAFAALELSPLADLPRVVVTDLLPAPSNQIPASRASP